MQDNEYSVDMNQQAQAPSLPMKWHKFLIYFSLWAGAVLNLLSAYQYSTGVIYGSLEKADIIYSLYDGLKFIDTMMTVMLIAIAVFSIVTRFALAQYKKNGPALLMALYILNIVCSAAYIFMVSNITALGISELMDSSSYSSLISSIVMIFINKIYYDKRASLFVN